MTDPRLADFTRPADVITSEKRRLEVAKFGDGQVARITLDPGWRWSLHVRPTAGTELCEIDHFLYHVSGTLMTVMKDRREIEATAGQVSFLPAGHDAWVVGDEPAVLIDLYGSALSVPR